MSRRGQGGHPRDPTQHSPGRDRGFGPPTGRQFEGYLITISRIEGGKIVEDWDATDNGYAAAAGLALRTVVESGLRRTVLGSYSQRAGLLLSSGPSLVLIHPSALELEFCELSLLGILRSPFAGSHAEPRPPSRLRGP